jgi:hypothetical protein
MKVRSWRAVRLSVSWLLLIAMEERPLCADAPRMPDAVPVSAESFEPKRNSRVGPVQ